MDDIKFNNIIDQIKNNTLQELDLSFLVYKRNG